MKNISPLYINSLLKAEGGTNSVNRKCNPLQRSCVSCARNAGESAIWPVPAATLCGDRACRLREMQARVRSARNPLRRSCVPSARNAGESGICPARG